MTKPIHHTLPCGIELGAVHLPRRHVVAFQIRLLAGACSEPADRAGLASLVCENIDKGTEKRSGPELLDAFDAIGAARSAASGREATTLNCTILPEHFEQAVALHAEFLRTPTFPVDSFDISIELARQELVALEDDAHGLADKLLTREVFGPLLGRHPLGTRESIDAITRDDLTEHCAAHFHAGRMVVSVAGAIEPDRVAAIFQQHFDGFGSADQVGRQAYPVEFTPGNTHHEKELEQQQIGIAFPGVGATHDDFPTQCVALGVLSGGMSGRLFTEIREKQGLVYWVSAWHDTPRGTGMIFLGASTKPERCDRTYAALLAEMERLGADLQQDEIDRAKTGIFAARETRGDSTRARCNELANDLFFFGRPVPTEEKNAKIEAVTIDGIRRFLDDHPRDALCVVTLGPKPLVAAESTPQPGAAASA